MYTITKLLILSPPDVIPFSTIYLLMIPYHFTCSSSTSAALDNFTFIQLKNQEYPSADLCISLIQICPVWFGALWTLGLPVFPSLPLNLRSPLDFTCFPSLSYIQRFSWGIKLGQLYDSLWLISQKSLFFVTRLSMSC